MIAAIAPDALVVFVCGKKLHELGKYELPSQYASAIPFLVQREEVWPDRRKNLKSKTLNMPPKLLFYNDLNGIAKTLAGHQ